jgi:hypothetical protein
VLGIEREFRRDQAMINTIYSEARNSLSAHFSLQADQVRQLAANCQSVINSQRQAGIAQFAEPLRQVITGRDKQEIRAVRSPRLNTEPRWMMPNRAPSRWNDFHSGFRYRSSLSDVTQEAWDLFFGREGVSSYYSMSDSHWKDYTPRFTFDRSFHMGGVRHAPPVRGCYMERTPPAQPHAQPGTRPPQSPPRPAQPAPAPIPHRPAVYAQPEARPVQPIRTQPMPTQEPNRTHETQPVPTETESHIRVGFGGTRRR